MNARELYKAGKLNDTIASLNLLLQENPTDRANRTFLFELLCFAGQYDRAEKQLGILEQEGNPDSMLAILVYRAALHAERIRQDMFDKPHFSMSDSGSIDSKLRGKLNGKEFESLSDADPRIGAKLEVFAAGDYLWISFRDIASLTIEPPRRLRDLLWLPGEMRTGPSFETRDLGEVLLPTISPLSWHETDDEVRLGRLTAWKKHNQGPVIPFGQKLLLVDGEEIPFLEVRELEIYPLDISGQPAV